MNQLLLLAALLVLPNQTQTSKLQVYEAAVLNPLPAETAVMDAETFFRWATEQNNHARELAEMTPNAVHGIDVGITEFQGNYTPGAGGSYSLIGGGGQPFWNQNHSQVRTYGQSYRYTRDVPFELINPFCPPAKKRADGPSSGGSASSDYSNAR